MISGKVSSLALKLEPDFPARSFQSHDRYESPSCAMKSPRFLSSPRPMHKLSAPVRCQHCDKTGHSSNACLLRAAAFTQSESVHLRCICCRKPGHANCRKIDLHERAEYCCKCGEKGHGGKDCRHQVADCRQTFNRNVKDYMVQVHEDRSDSDDQRPQTSSEKRYWEKVINKAFKKAKRLRREQRSRSR